VSKVLTGIAQRASQTWPGRSLGRVGYRFVARAAARWLAQLDAVDGVYVTGSLTRHAHVQPGYSDIDLVLVKS
jgi:hypothetical protein